MSPHTSLSIWLAALIFAGTAPRVAAQAYGLTQRPDVAAYYDNVLPPQPPTPPTNFSTVVAFTGSNMTFLNPVGLTHMPGTTKLVVWEREGRVYQFENNPAANTKTLVLDVSANCQGWDDSGLLGLAFHPNFVTNRYVYIWYSWRGGIAGSTGDLGPVIGNPNTRPPTNTPSRNRLSRFTLDANGVAVPGSEFVIIDQKDFNVWHNGGGMFFHPQNGFLYITNGDDANTGNSQRIDASLYSGVLRIDVDKRGGSISHAPPRRATNEVSPNWPAHFIPNDNPFVGLANACEEFWAIGLRSPHRMTFDPPTGRIFIGDVGAGAREEITIIEPGDPFGVNMQWSRIEGLGGNLTQPFIGVDKPPVIDYLHGSDGNCIVGGYVYRGTAFPELYGKYIFGDNGNGKVWYLNENTTPATKVQIATLPDGPGPNSGNDYRGLGSFGLDANGELYICQLGHNNTVNPPVGGRIYKLQRGSTPGPQLPARLSQVGVFSDLATLTPSSKLIPYALNAPFWSDSAVKSRWAAIPNGTTVGFTPTGDWTFPAGSVFVKHFELPVDDNNASALRRLETRLLVRMASGGVYGATYKWRADNTDADLLDGDLTESIPIAISPVGALTGADIGGSVPTGSTTRVGDAVTIVAGGSDIWNATDQFHFAYQQRTGDFDISVRLESLTQANLYTKAGLMARESLAAGSRHVYAMAFPSNAARNNNNGGYEFQYRMATGGTSAAIYPAVPQPLVNYPNTWLRLRREGNTFSAFCSSDALLWTEFARYTLALPQTLFFGLAVTSHTTAATTTAKFHLQNTRLQSWYFPSRADCTTCHTQQAGGGVLGLKTRQLNKNLLFPSAVMDNQLRAWNHVGLFSSGPQESDISNFDKLAHVSDLGESLEKRARSYLDANCANCHRPGGAQAFWDGRYDTPLAQQGIVYGQVSNTLGVPNAKVVVPQDLAKSILHLRVNKLGTNQMPPIAKNQIDRVGADLLAAWIASLTPNSPPTVALTSPGAGNSFERFTPIPLLASASDLDGIVKVEFYNGATKIGEDTTSPYEFVWSTAPAGAQTIKAVAIDGFGNSSESSATITIVNPPTNFAVNVNFQLGTAPVPSGYLKDDGSIFANRGNGYTYGWNRDNTPDARDRGLLVDQRYDTLVHFQKTHGDGTTTSYWEMAVPNGVYDVRIVGGDLANTDGFHEITAEGQLVTPGLVTDAQRFVEGTGTVTVSDGRLRLAPSANASTCKICFTDIRRLMIAPSAALTGIASGTSFLSTDAIALTASAADVDGNVMKVEFFDGNLKLGEDTTAPYAWTWSGLLQPGQHALRVVATDNEGRVTSSAIVTVTVLPFELKLLSMTPVGANSWEVQLGTTLPTGRTYTIQHSTNLLGGWVPVQSGTSNGQPFVVTVTVNNADESFFRVVSP